MTFSSPKKKPASLSSSAHFPILIFSSAPLFFVDQLSFDHHPHSHQIHFIPFLPLSLSLSLRLIFTFFLSLSLSLWESLSLSSHSSFSSNRSLFVIIFSSISSFYPFHSCRPYFFLTNLSVSEKDSLFFSEGIFLSLTLSLSLILSCWYLLIQTVSYTVKHLLLLILPRRHFAHSPSFSIPYFAWSEILIQTLIQERGEKEK